MTQLPVYLHLDQVKTNFVYLRVLLNTDSVPDRLKPYLPLFLELLTESPVLVDGELMPYENVVARLADDTVTLSTSLGVSGGSRFLPGSFAQYASLYLQVRASMK